MTNPHFACKNENYWALNASSTRLTLELPAANSQESKRTMLHFAVDGCGTEK
jgi:hypothetical protein